MSLGHRDGAPPRPTLKLFLAEESDVSLGCGPRGLSPEMTLPEFFEEWYVPVVTKTADWDEKSINLLRVSLRWWAQLTGDPPLRLIDDFTIANFAAGLRNATYRRGKLGVLRRLGETTVANHLRHIQWILVRCGMKSSAQPQAAALIDPPFVPQKPVVPAPKRPFTTQQWRALFARGLEARVPKSNLIRPALFWQALYATLFYTGFRIGTVLRLRWEHLVADEGEWWLDVPKAIVSKTEKATKRVVHPSLFAALQLVRQDDSPLIFPHGAHACTLGDWHKEMQAEIGIAQPMGWNAWRRTFTAELARLGYQQTVKILQQALDHSDSSTTTSHYYDPKNDFIRRLPSVEMLSAERQLTLF